MGALQPLRSPHQSLFWSAPRSFEAEFVIEDPLAFDYLNQQVGYWLFGGLTTRTSRAQYFAMVIYGLQLVEDEVSSRVVAASDADRKELFERWERLWALATLESRDGDMPSGDPDTIRGQRGLNRAWKSGDGALPLDYKLIGRQSELGALGAYLTSLRRFDIGLVFPGSFRPTGLAAPIIEAFWDEPGAGAWVKAYREVARSSLDLDRKTIPRKHGAVTLAQIGRLTRLSALTERDRTVQQRRLWEVLFENATDHTLALAGLVRAAHARGITAPRELLIAALDGKLGTVTGDQSAVLAVALAFGDAAQALMTCFNRAFQAAVRGGYRVDAGVAAAAAFSGPTGAAVRSAFARLLDLPEAARFHRMPVHGAAFLRLGAVLRDAAPDDALDAMVTLHAAVHRERSHGTPWIRVEGGRLFVDVGAYANRADGDGAFPSFKLDVVRRLLGDLGRLS